MRKAIIITEEVNCYIAPMHYQAKTRENEGTERDIEGVGWDMSIPLKLFYSQGVVKIYLLISFLHLEIPTPLIHP